MKPRWIDRCIDSLQRPNTVAWMLFATVVYLGFNILFPRYSFDAPGQVFPKAVFFLSYLGALFGILGLESNAHQDEMADLYHREVMGEFKEIKKELAERGKITLF